ncbi:MAG: hypothetical protein EPN40_07660, partial [Rhodanobacteraceae bacterium]
MRILDSFRVARARCLREISRLHTEARLRNAGLRGSALYCVWKPDPVSHRPYAEWQRDSDPADTKTQTELGITDSRSVRIPFARTPGFHRFAFAAAALILGVARADEAPREFVPQLLGAQYTFVDQHQYALRSPYAGPLSLLPQGDTEQSHTFGAYFGVRLPAHLQFYFDVEMFKGEGLSGATGVAAIVNGDVVHSGNAGLGKRAYVARRYLRWSLPLGGATHAVDRGQDQLPGAEADRHVEAKLGRMAPSDDFDKNRYANSARTQFMDGAFFN